MKRTTALYAATVLVALSFAGQAFAKGGRMGGGQIHGNTGGTHQMAATMSPGSGNGMQQRTMQRNGLRNMEQDGMGNGVGQRNGKTSASGTGPTSMQPPATAATN